MKALTALFAIVALGAFLIADTSVRAESSGVNASQTLQFAEASSAAAQAASPMQTVETHVNRLLAVLQDHSQKKESKEEAIRAISSSLFDFTELSRFTLGRNWRKFNSEQQKTFVVLYRKLLESVYMDRLLQYKNQKVVMQKETALSDNRAEVLTNVVAAGSSIAMGYKMIRKDATWKVYDLVIENVSLVRNYRSQFSSLLAKNPPAKLLDILREKVKS